MFGGEYCGRPHEGGAGRTSHWANAALELNVKSEIRVSVARICLVLVTFSLDLQVSHQTNAGE